MTTRLRKVTDTSSRNGGRGRCKTTTDSQREGCSRRCPNRSCHRTSTRSSSSARRPRRTASIGITQGDVSSVGISACVAVAVPVATAVDRSANSKDSSNDETVTTRRTVRRSARSPSVVSTAFHLIVVVVVCICVRVLQPSQLPLSTPSSTAVRFAEALQVPPSRFPVRAASSAAAAAETADADRLLLQLQDRILQAPKNGIDTPVGLEQDIVSICESLRTHGDTSRRDYDGFWKLLWTNLKPAAPSCGKLGPFVGTVYQQVELSAGSAKNILQLWSGGAVVVLNGSLAGTADPSTLAITFESITAQLFGRSFGTLIEFPQDDDARQVRQWRHIYMDGDYRILYAKNPESGTDAADGFLFVMQRADEDRFDCS